MCAVDRLSGEQRSCLIRHHICRPGWEQTLSSTSKVGVGSGRVVASCGGGGPFLLAWVLSYKRCHCPVSGFRVEGSSCVCVCVCGRVVSGSLKWPPHLLVLNLLDLVGTKRGFASEVWDSQVVWHHFFPWPDEETHVKQTSFWKAHSDSDVKKKLTVNIVFVIELQFEVGCPENIFSPP